MRRSIGVALVLLTAFATNVFAGVEARQTGKVTDAATGAPIAGATILVENAKGAGRTFKQEFKTDKDGNYTIFLIDGTLRYDFTFSATGYAPFKETVKLQIGQSNTRDIKLVPGTGGAAIGAAKVEVDPAVVAYNDGAGLANEGKLDEAIVKMEEAVKIKADLVMGYQSLARLYLRQKNFDKAIDRATKALEFDAEDQDMNAVLYEAYHGKGDKAKAETFKSKMPANAGVLFNDAAKAINASNDGEAEPLLQKAIATDPKFAPAYYELGMLYVRAGKNADARLNLEKYLELEPAGKDAPTAKEMLKYVK